MLARLVVPVRAAILRRRILSLFTRVERSDVDGHLASAQARVWLRQATELQQRLARIEGRQQ